jgi:Domain of unknown function (DUF3850)
VPSENHATAVKPSRQRQVLSSNSRQLTSTRRAGRETASSTGRNSDHRADARAVGSRKALAGRERGMGSQGMSNLDSVQHELKSWPEFFEPVLRRTKNFELRKNDRGYKIGDVLLLREWDPKTKIYSGRECRRTVEYVLEGIGTGGIEPLKGLSIGYCILGLS